MPNFNRIKKLNGSINLRVHRNKNFTHSQKKKTDTVIDRLSDPESLGLTNPALTVEGFELLRFQAEIQARGADWLYGGRIVLRP